MTDTELLRSPLEVQEELIKKNPNIKTLIDKFDLYPG